MPHKQTSSSLMRQNAHSTVETEHGVVLSSETEHLNAHC